MSDEDPTRSALVIREADEMQRHDWIYAGVKLIAVCFAGIGVATGLVVAAGLVVQSSLRLMQLLATGEDPWLIPSYNLFSLAQPLGFVAVGWLLGRNTGLIMRALRVPTAALAQQAHTTHDHTEAAPESG
ncbi:MAG: hypothetical protein AAF078_01030 [Planctomycetota bacterium]